MSVADGDLAIEDDAVEEIDPFAIRLLPWILSLGGIIGCLSSIMLTIEKMNKLADKDYQPICQINTLLSCTNVMTSPQSAVFGFSNTLLGIAGFAVVAAIGMGMLAGGRFTHWYWFGLQAGSLFGIVFVIWLQYQTAYHIQALCPWCMIVWVVMIPIFIYTTIYNLFNGNLPVPRSWLPGVDVLAKYVERLTQAHLVKPTEAKGL